MNTEILSIINALEAVHSGASWYGKSVIEVFDAVDEKVVYVKPSGNSHSLIDLLYHMVTWQEFTLRRLQKIQEANPADVDELDWRIINPEIHTWKHGVEEFKAGFQGIKALLQTAPETLLEEIVDYRDYNFRYLLNGLVQHNIYHLGQVAYAQKLLS